MLFQYPGRKGGAASGFVICSDILWDDFGNDRDITVVLTLNEKSLSPGAAQDGFFDDVGASICVGVSQFFNN